MAEATPSPETVAHDDLCPVCHQLLYAPVKTQCSHVLCASCMAQWADVFTSNTVASDLDLDLTSFDPNYDALRDLEANCPMCRTPTFASPDNERASDLAQQYPVIYKERQAEEEVNSGQMSGRDGVEGVILLIGNRHELVTDAETANQHEWTFFVRCSRPEMIEEVRVYLHPTFRQPRLVLRRAPYQVKRLGWGTFAIQATVHLKEPYVWVKDPSEGNLSDLKTEWMLSFEGRGRQMRLRAKARKQTEEVPDSPPQRPANWPHLERDDERDE